MNPRDCQHVQGQRQSGPDVVPVLTTSNVEVDINPHFNPNYLQLRTAHKLKKLFFPNESLWV